MRCGNPPAVFTRFRGFQRSEWQGLQFSDSVKPCFFDGSMRLVRLCLPLDGLTAQLIVFGSYC